MTNEEERDALREKYAGLTIQELARVMVDLRTEKEKRDEELKLLNAELEFVCKGLLPERMDEENVTKMSITGLGTLYLQGDLYVSTVGDKQTLFQFMRESGNESLITETINPSTLKAWCKEQYKQGNDIPEDLLKVQPYSFAKVLKK
jgi:hypothetical protein